MFPVENNVLRGKLLILTFERDENMLIWNRKGFLVPLITLLTLALTEYLVELAFNNSNYYQEHGWAPFMGLAIVGVFCTLLGNRLNKDQNKKFIDKETGEEVRIKIKHTFFFISVEHWGLILPIIGLIIWIIE